MQEIQDFFSKVLAFIQSRVSTEILIYICIAILVLILIWIISRSLRRKKAHNRFEDLQNDLNEIHNNTLDFKFNKAQAFAKANADIMERVKDLTPKYDVCRKSVDECDDICQKASDLLDRNRVKKAMRSMDELETAMDDTQERIRIVTKALDHILERETEIREFSNALKERFRNVKTVYKDNRSNFYSSTDYFDSRLDEIEGDFTNFEEWMYASEFNKAKEEGTKISQTIDEVSSKIAAAPGLYEKAKFLIPQALEEVKVNINDIKEENVDLSYLNVDQRIEKTQEDIEYVVKCLDGGNLETAEEMLDSIGDEVLTIQEEITAEKDAYDEIHEGLEMNLATVGQIDEELTNIKELYANTKDRFGLEDWTHRFELADEQMANLREARELIKKELEQDEMPSVDVIHYYREFDKDVTEFSTQIKEMKERVEGASSDEARAKKQLVKLQLILNEVRLNAATRNLPNISNQFYEDIRQGENLIHRVQVVLSHSPLDVQTLNADLQDAIDFVYKLYNNANNLIGVAVMVENAIVFGNRFRSSYPSMDSDLTRAELCFQNGEYTRALKIAIQAIENLHPGIYEKLVARKDPAVMNQV